MALYALFVARKVEQEIEQLSALAGAPALEALPALRKALADRVNLVAAKAAKIAAARQVRELIPDLLRAFDRMLETARPGDAATALEALAIHRATPEIRAAAQAAVEHRTELRERFCRLFSE